MFLLEPQTLSFTIVGMWWFRYNIISIPNIDFSVACSTYFRFHDKVVIEEELNDLRHQNSTAWETTKYHLKLAKTNTSLRNIEQLTLVGDHDDQESQSETETKNGKLTTSETEFITVR